MTAKHFKALAARIAKIDDLAARQEAAKAVADVATGDNGRFDRVRFFTACGLEG